jgi:hypothetical protein
MDLGEVAPAVTQIGHIADFRRDGSGRYFTPNITRFPVHQFGICFSASAMFPFHHKGGLPY